MHEKNAFSDGPGHPLATPPPGMSGDLPDVVIRRIRSDDGPATRALRLEALADTPLAYMDTVADAAARPLILWDALAAERASGDAAAAFVADAGGTLVANSAAVADANGRTALVGVYVTPPWRGTGLIARLVDAVAQWSLSVGRDELCLYVADGNPRAVRAYERLGFAFTGHVMEHTFHPQIVEREMIRPAAWPAAVGGHPGAG